MCNKGEYSGADFIRALCTLSKSKTTVKKTLAGQLLYLITRGVQFNPGQMKFLMNA